MKCQVLVGNIGMVYEGGDIDEANRVFSDYVELSKSEYGRAGGEQVILFCDADDRGYMDVEAEYCPDDEGEY